KGERGAPGEGAGGSIGDVRAEAGLELAVALAPPPPLLGRLPLRPTGAAAPDRLQVLPDGRGVPAQLLQVRPDDTARLPWPRKLQDRLEQSALSPVVLGLGEVHVRRLRPRVVPRARPGAAAQPSN